MSAPGSTLDVSARGHRRRRSAPRPGGL